jgi:preprotein translocase subunit YajC
MFHRIVAHLASLDLPSLLAQAKGGNGGGQGAGDGGFFGLPWWAPLPIIVILFYFMLIRPQQRERKTVQQMLDNLKKNDRVLLQSGIVGTIVNIQQDARFVTIKIDESTNTKLKVLRSAISRVVSDDEDDDKKKSEGS